MIFTCVFSVFHLKVFLKFEFSLPKSLCIKIINLSTGMAPNTMQLSVLLFNFLNRKRNSNKTTYEKIVIVGGNGS